MLAGAYITTSRRTREDINVNDLNSKIDNLPLHHPYAAKAVNVEYITGIMKQTTRLGI